MSTETAIFSLNKGDKENFERQVEAVTVSTGELFIASGDGRSKNVKAPDTYETNGSPTVSVFAVDHSSYAVTFTENAVAPVFQNATAIPDEISNADVAARPNTDPARDSEPSYPTHDRTGDEGAPELAEPRTVAGDSDPDSPTGGTGSYEDRTVAELKATAEKKGVDLEGATKKSDIIEKLRG